MRKCRLAYAVAAVALLAASLATSAEVFENDTRETAYGIRIEFSRSVRITDHGREFSTQEPQSNSNEFIFSGGTVRHGGTFEVEWSPSSAGVREYQWLFESDLVRPEPVLTILADYTYGVAPLEVSLEAVLEHAPSDTVVPIEWGFGDGCGGTGEAISHVFLQLGTFTNFAIARLPDGSILRAVFVISVSPLHVDAATGDDEEGDGSELAPFKTIARASTQAQPGQALLLAPGVYNAASGEPAVITIPDQVHLVGRSVSPEETKVLTAVTCQGSSVLYGISFFRKVTLQEEREQIAQPYVGKCIFNHTDMSVYLTSGSARVEDCSFSGGDFPAINVHGTTDISNCTITSGSLSCIYIYADTCIRSCTITDAIHGILIADSADVEVTDTLITQGEWDSFRSGITVDLWNSRHVVHLTVDTCRLDGGTWGIKVSGNGRVELAVQKCVISNTCFGISLRGDVFADLGGGAIGSAGGNSFRDNLMANLIDARTPYLGPLYAVGNDWGSPVSGSISGPDNEYAPARCNILYDGNSIIFSD